MRRIVPDSIAELQRISEIRITQFQIVLDVFFLDFAEYSVHLISIS